MRTILGSDNVISRTDYLNRLLEFKDTEFIKVITGVRRSGKSVLLRQYAQKLSDLGVPDTNIIYINFEEFDFSFIREEEQLRDVLKSHIDTAQEGRCYILLDEIQNISGWQRVINAIRVSFPADITVTGSNAQMLSGELATLLSGRYVEIPVWPLSFREFLLAKNIDEDSRGVDRAYNEYEKFGGFPSVVLSHESIKDTVLSGIFDSIVLNDIALRSGIRDTSVLKSVIAFLSDNTGQLVNPTRIANVLKSQGLVTSHHTIAKYLESLENAFLFYKVQQYDLRGKEYLKSNAKFFSVDNGLRRHAVGFRGGNLGNRLENVVYVELLRRGYRIDVGKIGNQEIDFVARRVDEIVYVQVAYDLPENTHESDNLLKIDDNYKKIIVTGRYTGVNDVDGVEVKYIVDWLLEN